MNQRVPVPQVHSWFRSFCGMAHESHGTGKWGVALEGHPPGPGKQEAMANACWEAAVRSPGSRSHKAETKSCLSCNPPASSGWPVLQTPDQKSTLISTEFSPVLVVIFLLVSIYPSFDVFILLIIILLESNKTKLPKKSFGSCTIFLQITHDTTTITEHILVHFHPHHFCHVSYMSIFFFKFFNFFFFFFLTYPPKCRRRTFS